jgi:mannosyltransferase
VALPRASERAAEAAESWSVPPGTARRALLVYTGLALILRLFRLGHQSLWMDEVLSATNADHPWRSLLFDPAVDRNFPPLYNLVVHGVQQWLGRGDTLLRLPSAVAGVLSVPLFFLAVRRWVGDRLALTGALLLAISPLHVWYSQEARPYALLLLFALATLWCAARSLREPHRVRWLVGFTAAAAATFYTHLIAIPFLGVIGGYLLLRTPPRHRLRAVGALAALALLALPQLLRFAGAPPTLSGNSDYQFQLSHLGYTGWAFMAGFSLGPSLLELRGGMPAVRPYLSEIVPVMLLTAALFLLGGRLLWRERREACLVLAGWIVAVGGFAVAGAVLSSHPYNVRYVILALPPFLLVTAAGVHAVRSTPVRVTAATVWGSIAAISLGNYYAAPKYSREDNRAAVAFLNGHAAPGDLVIATAPYTALALRYYGLRDDLELLPYPASGLVAEGQPARELGPATGDRLRVWLFASREFHSDPGGRIGGFLGTRYRAADRFRAAGVRVVRYQRPAPGASSP